MCQLLFGHAEEGTAGAGQDQSADLSPVLAAHKALKNSRVLGVHRHDFRPVFLRFLHHQLPSADKGLFVGKADTLFRPDRSQSGPQPQHAHHRGDHTIRLGKRRRGNQAFFSPENLGGKVPDRVGQHLGALLGSHDSELRPELPALLRHTLYAAAGSQSADLDLRVHPHHIQALSADGAGRAQNTDTIHHFITPPKVR